MNYWLISDTHFNHEKLTDWGGRTGDWQMRLLHGIRDIPAGDTLIHLGDICIGNDREIHDQIKFLAPEVRRILVRGNHDKASLQFYNERWDFVCDAFALETMGHRILFSHRPRHPDGDNYTHNIHGHTHGNLHRSEEYIAFYDKGFHIDISPELIGYKPIKLETLMQIKPADRKYPNYG